MRSSGSTPNPPRRVPIVLRLLVAGEDHPKACTGRRLLRRGEAVPVSAGRSPRRPPVLLDPRANVPLSPADRKTAVQGGVMAVDCSWNRLAERGGYPTEAPWLRRLAVRRRLPFLIAANPQHYGRLAELNTMEAFAAALAVLGEADRARRLVASFAGGPAFLEINGDRLGRYAQAQDASEVLSAEQALFG